MEMGRAGEEKKELVGGIGKEGIDREVGEIGDMNGRGVEERKEK